MNYELWTILLSSGIALITLDGQEYEENWPKKETQEEKGKRRQKTPKTQKDQKKGKKIKDKRSCPGIQLAIAKETEQV